MRAKFVDVVGVMTLCCAASPVEAQTASASAPGCVLLYDTMGGRSGDAKVDGFWATVDQAVGKFTTDALTGRGVTVRYVLSDVQHADQQLAEVVKQLKSTMCERVVQIVRHNGGGKDAPNFSYSVQLFHFDQTSTDGGTKYKVVSDFTKEYKYPLTQETFRTLAPSALGEQIAGDIAASKAMERAVPTPH